MTSLVHSVLTKSTVHLYYNIVQHSMANIQEFKLIEAEWRIYTLEI